MDFSQPVQVLLVGNRRWRFFIKWRSIFGKQPAGTFQASIEKLL